MNFLTMDRQDGTLVGEAISYPLSNGMGEAVGDTTALTLGIRPEDVRIHTVREHDTDVPATVDVVEPVGDANNVYLRLDGADADAISDLETVEDEGDESTIVATVDGLDRIAADASVFLHLPPDAIHLFDRETGAALRSRHVEGATGP
jgi:multiple sugar transport system ATP-binding protein